ncbi:MAG: gamma-butyrobetaine hydroxylase-like domain-containing protein [Parvibaculaceae bacterium]
MSNLSAPVWPTEIRLKKSDRQLHVTFDDGKTFALDAEFLRVESPSAEVQGHGTGQKTTVAGKRLVTIERLEPVGNYALRIIFGDGHDSGLFTWETLYRLGRDHDEIWAGYIAALTDKGLSRD